jgi:hypothetical protein
LEISSDKPVKSVDVLKLASANQPSTLANPSLLCVKSASSYAPAGMSKEEAMQAYIMKVAELKEKYAA